MLFELFIHDSNQQKWGKARKGRGEIKIVFIIIIIVMLLDMYDLAVRITLESVNVTWTMKAAGNRPFVITLRLGLCWLAKTQYIFFATIELVLIPSTT